MAFGSYDGNCDLFCLGRRGTTMSIVICFCSKVGCLRHIVYHLDLTLIVSALSVTLYSVIWYVRFRNSVLPRSRHHIWIPEHHMSNWIIWRAICGATIFGKTFHNNKPSRNKWEIVSCLILLSWRKRTKNSGKLFSDDVWSCNFWGGRQAWKIHQKMNTEYEHNVESSAQHVLIGSGRHLV